MSGGPRSVPASAFTALIDTPIGRMVMRSDGRSLTGLCLEDWWWAKRARPVVTGGSADSAVLGDAARPVVLGDADHPVVLGDADHPVVLSDSEHPVVLSERSESKDLSARSGVGVRPLHLAVDAAALGKTGAPDASAGAAHVFDLTRRWLGEYFGVDGDAAVAKAGASAGVQGRQPDWTPPLDMAASGVGTPFRREVWSLVREIPWGRTVSYGDLAAELSSMRGGRPMAAQAVGGAVKHNPITIIVPCHRVVGAGRAFGGYGGRLDVKAALLEHEGVDLRRFDGIADGVPD